MASPADPIVIHATRALLPGGWADDVRIAVDEAGRIRRVDVGAKTAHGDHRHATIVPGCANLHSHTFQRALGAATQRVGGADDDFWRWREAMYALVGRLDPDEFQAITTAGYRELRARGYTSVAEFHYVHHDRDGRPFTNPVEMAERVIVAARDAGIALTLLPVVYQWGGFTRRPLAAHQRRFAADVDWVLDAITRLKRHEGPDLVVGAAVHSLRAVEAAEVRRLVNALPGPGPLHVHVAEQQREVDECVAATGRRPIDLLLDIVGIDTRWFLVHATQADAGEIDRVAASGATVVLCPTTEADLGDGLFDLDRHLRAGGRWGIGSDANVCRDPIEELRLLEYGQRLRAQRRNFGARPAGTPIADWAWRQAAGAADPSRPAMSPGARADLLSVRFGDQHNGLAGPMFCGEGMTIEQVFVGGRPTIQA